MVSEKLSNDLCLEIAELLIWKLVPSGLKNFLCDFFSDLIHAFSELPRDLNFIQHTSRLGWKL